MKKYFYLILIFLNFGCVNNKTDDPLIIPPNFAEVTDPNKPEQPTPEQKNVEVERLKDLLLKGDE